MTAFNVSYTIWWFEAAGINDGSEHAVELAEMLHRCGHGYHVNLIPYNPIEGSEYRRPYKKAVNYTCVTLITISHHFLINTAITLINGHYVGFGFITLVTLLYLFNDLGF